MDSSFVHACKHGKHPDITAIKRDGRDTSHMTQTLLSIPDFCARYRVSRTTVYRQRNAGNLPMFKVGRATRIRVSDAEKWAANLINQHKAA
jgi:excisionase family DNA binding protein